MIEIRTNDDKTERQRKNYITAIIVTIAGNIILAVGKAVAASITGSSALYSDAANSISDVLYSALVAVGLYVAMQPADQSHPQGHSRFEPLVGLVVTASMAIAAYEAGHNAVDTFIAGPKSIQISLPSLILLASASIKTVMFFLIRSIANRQDSPSLRAIAADNLSDIISSVIVFIGTAASNLFPIFDPIAGLLVAVWILYAAFRSGKENLVYLTGGSAPQDVRDRIILAASSVPGVRNVHHLITEYVGPHLIVDMHCDIDPALTFVKAHEITDEITTKVENLVEVDRAYVHLEPGEKIVLQKKL